MSYGYPDGCTQADHDRAFDELGPAPNEDDAYEQMAQDELDAKYAEKSDGITLVNRSLVMQELDEDVRF